MGAIKAKLESFKAPKTASAGRRGSVKMPKGPGKPAKVSGGGSKMSPTSMFYLGRTMKRDQDAREAAAANNQIAIDQQGAGLNNAAAIGQTLQEMNAQLDALLGL